MNAILESEWHYLQRVNDYYDISYVHYLPIEDNSRGNCLFNVQTHELEITENITEHFCSGNIAKKENLRHKIMKIEKKTFRITIKNECSPTVTSRGTAVVLRDLIEGSYTNLIQRRERLQ